MLAYTAVVLSRSPHHAPHTSVPFLWMKWVNGASAQGCIGDKVCRLWKNWVSHTDPIYVPRRKRAFVVRKCEYGDRAILVSFEHFVYWRVDDLKDRLIEKANINTGADMLNPTNGEPGHVVKYVEEYLDLVESLPYDLQRSVSIMKEIDAKYQDVLMELDEAYEKYCQETDPVQRRKLQLSIQRALIRSQELGDEKIQIAGQMVELVENRTRQMDWHSEVLLSSQEVPESHVTTATSLSTTAASLSSAAAASITPGKTAHHEKKRDEVTPSSGSGDKTGGKRSRRQKNGDNRESYGGLDHSDDVGVGASREKRAKASSKKKKRSKGKSEREVSPPDLPIDPDEPTYCLCEQVSYGEMIGCDNDECPIEWFHFSCVGLHHKPKGKWYCPKCRGDNEKTMDKALERAKKERAYNR